MKDYRLVIEELNNKVVANEDSKSFTMNTVADTAKSGDTALLERLYQATKVLIFEFYEDNSYMSCEYPSKQKYFLAINYFCTPRKTNKAIKGHIAGIVSAGDEMITRLVEFHNLYVNQTGMPKVSLDELKALYQATQSERS